MNTKDKIELSLQIVEKVSEVNEVLKQTKKEGFTIDWRTEGIGNSNSLLYIYLVQKVIYADTEENFIEDESIDIDKTLPARLIIEKLNEKQDELNELVKRANNMNLFVHYTGINPMHVNISETIVHTN